MRVCGCGCAWNAVVGVPRNLRIFRKRGLKYVIEFLFFFEVSSCSVTRRDSLDRSWVYCDRVLLVCRECEVFFVLIDFGINENRRDSRIC